MTIRHPPSRPLRAGKSSIFPVTTIVCHRFYIENIPPSWSGLRVRRSFEKLGRVDDFFIPRKLNKAGLRFGFVTYRGDEAIQQVYENINNVWLDSYKIRANTTRFDKGTTVQYDKPRKRIRKDMSMPRLHFDSFRDGRRYVDVARGETNRNADATNVKDIASDIRECSRDGFVQDIQQVDTNMEWLNRSAIGHVHKIELIPSLFEHFAEEKVDWCVVRTLGGNEVLLTFDTEEKLEEILEDMYVWKNAWFRNIKRWELSYC